MTVEGDSSNVRLFTISNPYTSSKAPALVIKWCGKNYSQEKCQTLKGCLGSLSITDNGRYLAAGTMNGKIYIMISFSLQVSTLYNSYTLINSIFIIELM